VSVFFGPNVLESHRVSTALSLSRETVSAQSIGARAKIVYMAFTDLCEKGGGSTLATRAQVGRATGLNEKAIQRAIAELLDAGMIHRERDGDLPSKPFRTRLATRKRRK
jgi:DNA-binding transcriptional ArsR family regulator